MGETLTAAQLTELSKMSKQTMNHAMVPTDQLAKLVAGYSRIDPNATGATIPLAGQATIELGSPAPMPASSPEFEVTPEKLQKAIRFVTDPSPMPAPVRELVEAAEAGASYATYVHGGNGAAESIRNAIAAVRAHYGEKP